MTLTTPRSQRPGPLEPTLHEVLASLASTRAVERVWSGDHTLWSPDPTEIADRLGWLHVLDDVEAAADEVDGFVAGCRSDGLRRVVVMGMGGSSLFPEVIARSFPTAPGALALTVLDSTDPAAVGRVAALADPETTLFVASSKSGSTIETRSHLELFWERVGRGDRFAVITDPGSELGALARERGFRHVFENRPDIGGRYSALSFFGLVPAALAGVDWRGLVASARSVAQGLADPDPAANVGLVLGAWLAAGVEAGRDKATIVVDDRVEAFGLWLEQLLAESTGKQGTGVIPIVGEALGTVDAYGDDRLFVSIGDVDQAVGLDVLADAGHPVLALDVDDPLQLGAHVLIWEVATALCGAAIGIQPFDQPNVAEAKEATNQVLAGGDPPGPGPSLDELLAQVRPGDYLAVQAYVDPDDEVVTALEDARLGLRDELRVATTFGLGPRFLHSTGQLHKGGPPTGVFVQIVGEDRTDAEIPGRGFGFSRLKHAQADGDLLTLRHHGLRVARVAAADLIDRHQEEGA